MNFMSVQLLTKKMEVLVMNQDSAEGTRQQIDELYRRYSGAGEDNDDLALVIDGATLLHALSPE